MWAARTQSSISRFDLIAIIKKKAAGGIKTQRANVQTCRGNVITHEFLLQDPRRLQEVKWRMSCASSQPLIADMTVSPQKRWEKGGKEGGGARQAENVTKRFFFFLQMKGSRAANS